MTFDKNSRFLSLFTVILLSFSLVLAPLQTTAAETNEPKVNENDGDVTDTNDGDTNEDEIGADDESSDLDESDTIDTGNEDASASSDLDNSEITNDDTANEQQGKENPDTTNIDEKNRITESAQITAAEPNDNIRAVDFKYSVEKVTDTSFTISWNTVPNISSYDLSISYYPPNNEDAIELNYELANDQNEFTVEDLLPNTSYYITLLTNDTNGQQKDYYFSVKTNGEDANDDLVDFEDEILASAVAEELGIYGRDVTIEDMKYLFGLYVSNSNITSLKGLEHASNIDVLYADGNNISDISMLAGLTSLSDAIILSNNNISDISPLKNLNSINYLDLSSNNIESFDSLVELNSINFLYLDNNNISSLPKNPGSLRGLFNLTLSGNKLTDISNLKGFNHLTYLDLSDNKIKDISILKELDFKRIGAKPEIFLNGMEITDADTIKALRNRELIVYYDKDFKNPGHEDDSDNGGTDGTPGTDDDDTTPKDELEKVFPKNKGYVIGKNSVKIVVGDQQTTKLSSAQVKTLKDNNRSIVINRNGVELIIPSSIFNTNGDVEVSIKKLDDVDGSFGIFEFTIKQDGKTISKFNKAITLSFTVDAAKATNPNNLKIFYLNEETGKWELIGGTYNNGVVTATTDHFSTFAVFEVEPGSTGVGNSKTEELADQNEEEKGQVNITADKTDGGKQLPNTATNNFNLLLLGAFILAAGVITFYVRPKRVKAK